MRLLGLVWLIVVFLLVVSQRPERSVTDVDSLANCVAEMSYQNPQPNKMKELEVALRLCTEGR